MRHMRDTLAERINQLQREARGEEDGALGAGGSKAEINDDEGAGAGAGAREKDAIALELAALGASTRLRGAGLAASLMQQSKAAKIAAADEAKQRSAPAGSCAARLAAAGCHCCRARPLGVMAFATSSARQLNAMGSEPPRKFANSSRVFAGLLVRFVWPVLAFCAYYIGMFFVRSGAAVQAGYSRSAVLWTVELEMLVATIGYNVRNLMWSLEPGFTVTYTLKSDVDLATLMSVVKDIAFGSAERQLQSLIVTSPTTNKLFTVDGCVDNAVTPATCVLFGGPGAYYGCNLFYSTAMCRLPADNTNISYEVFNNGIVGHGLYPAVLQLELAARHLIDDTYAALASNVNVFESSDHVPGTRGDTINQMTESYLAAGLSALSAGVYGEATASIAVSNSNDVIAVVASSFAIFVLIVGVYRPLILKLDHEMKQSRTMLLLVPDEVAKAVPAVVMAAQKLAQFAQQQ
jgi:hypothetical protein